MRIRKGTAWVSGVIILVGIYILTLYTQPQILETIGGTIILAIAFATVGYQGMQVADNYQKARWYNKELEDK